MNLGVVPTEASVDPTVSSEAEITSHSVPG